MKWKYEKEVRELYSSDDWKIKVWTGESLDWVEDNAFVDYAKETGQWVFVSDYYRIKILEKYGGVYIDTDMLPVNKLTDDLLEKDFLMGYEFRNFITTGFCATVKESEFIKKMVSYYDSLVNPNFFTLSNLLATEVVYSTYDIGKGNKNRYLENAIILNRRAFSLWYESKSNANIYFIHKHDSGWIGNSFQKKLLEWGAAISKLTPSIATTIMSRWNRHMSDKRFLKPIKREMTLDIKNVDSLRKEDFNKIVYSKKWVTINLDNSNKHLKRTLLKIPNVKKVKLTNGHKLTPPPFEKVNFSNAKTDFISYNPKGRAKFETDINVMKRQFDNGHEKILMK